LCDTRVLVPIPDLLWEADAIYEFDPTHPEYDIDDQGQRCLRLDSCLAPIVQRMWSAGIVTRSCCCGHGDTWPIVTVKIE
jgi:hypothetical protein